MRRWRRGAQDAAPAAASAEVPHECLGECLSAERVGIETLRLDCVLDLGTTGYEPVTLAVQLSDNTGLALFEESLLQRWIAEDRSVEARLVVSRGRARVVLSTGEGGLVLPLRTAAAARP